MKKELNRFERIADGAFFAVDTRVFESRITPYDPMVANATLLTSQEKSDAIVTDESREQDINDLPLDA